MNINIRPASMSDLETLLEFEQGVINAERPMDITLKRDETFYYDIEDLINSSHIELAVAEIDKELVGTGYVRIERAKAHLQHKYYGYMGFMYVLPKARGKGVNKLIMRHLLEWCKKRKVYEIRLEVYDKNPIAIRAYEKVGFSSHLIEMRLNLDDKK